MVLACLSSEIWWVTTLRVTGVILPFLALAARPEPHPFVPGVELSVLCARQDLCQSLHLRSLIIEPLTAHRVACGGAPARQSDRQARGAVSPSRAELGSDWSSWGGVSSSEGPDPLCPTLDALTSTAQILISYSGSATGAVTVRSHPQAIVTVRSFGPAVRTLPEAYRASI